MLHNVCCRETQDPIYIQAHKLSDNDHDIKSFYIGWCQSSHTSPCRKKTNIKTILSRNQIHSSHEPYFHNTISPSQLNRKSQVKQNSSKKINNYNIMLNVWLTIYFPLHCIRNLKLKRNTSTSINQASIQNLIILQFVSNQNYILFYVNCIKQVGGSYSGAIQHLLLLEKLFFCWGGGKTILFKIKGNRAPKSHTSTLSIRTFRLNVLKCSASLSITM